MFYRITKIDCDPINTGCKSNRKWLCYKFSLYDKPNMYLVYSTDMKQLCCIHRRSESKPISNNLLLKLIGKEKNEKLRAILIKALKKSLSAK